MVDKQEQIISLGKRKSPLHGQTRSVISHDVMFKSGMLTRESPYKSKQVDSEFFSASRESEFVTI